MQRRHFLTSLLALLGAGRLAQAQPVAAGAKQTILIQHSPVAGFQYHDGENVWSQLAIGHALTLVREPDNGYDPQAVRIDWRGHTLGYVPRRENTAVSQMLDRGARLHARISTLRRDHDPWQRMRLAITLES